MGKKGSGEKENLILPLVFMAVLAVFALVGFVMPDRTFSAQENRVLAQKPALSAETVLEGTYMEQYENYVTDQFPGRDRFISVKARVQHLMGKKDINGVYFAPDNTLLERHGTESVDLEKANRKVERMNIQASQMREIIPGSVSVMLVPSASAVQLQRLPKYATEFDQAGWIEKAMQKSASAGAMAVDAYGALLQHGEENIYYGTDHHWTTLGAFYGYQAFCSANEMPVPELADYERCTVKDDFYGTLQAKVNLPVTPDTIEFFKKDGETEHSVRFVYEDIRSDSCYFYDNLEKKDAYRFFFDGNFPLVEMEGDGPGDRTILLIKDSYANCFAPFLTRDYGTVFMADPRYYRGDLTELAARLQPTDVLYLYNVFQFAESF